MRTWLPLIAVVLLASCHDSLAPPSYPATVSRGYRLYRETVLKSGQVPEVVPSSELVRVVQLVYDASNPIQLTVYETKASTVARDAKQKWVARGGSHAGARGRYFV